MVPADTLVLIDQLQREVEPQWREVELPKGMNRLACQMLMASQPGRFVCCAAPSNLYGIFTPVCLMPTSAGAEGRRGATTLHA